jgi:hypothetical protein
MLESYVYVIFRLDGSPCYVGMGRGRRWRAHFRCAHNPRLRALIQRAGGELPHVKVCEGLSHEDALAAERAWIAAIGRGRKGPLVNFTDGGEGTLGYKRTPEECAAISERVRKRVWTEAQKERARQLKLGSTQSDEVRAKIGAAHKGRKHSAEVRANMSEGQRGRKLSPEHIAKLAAILRRPKSEEHKAKLRAACIARNRGEISEETRQRMSDAQKGKPAHNKGRPMSEETKAKLSIAKKGRPSSFKGQKHTEETRAKMSAKRKGQTRAPTRGRTGMPH